MTATVEEYHGFGNLIDHWDGLLRRSAGGTRIFSTCQWQQLWWQAFGEGRVLRLLAVREAGSLIGIWPLMDDGNALALVGGADVCDYLDVIAVSGREREVLAAGMRHLRKQEWHLLDLRFLPESSLSLQYLPPLARCLGWTVEREVDDVCPAIELPSSWETYLASLSKKDRHELRRKLRRLDEAGELQWEICNGDEPSGRDAEDFVRLHRLSRPDKAAFMDRQMEDFFGSVIAHFAPKGEVKIFFLTLDGQRVATTLCLDHADELWVYNSGFDRAFSQYSVGLAVKAYCIRAAIEAGKRKVDFLRGREAYKYDLGARDVPVYRLRITKDLPMSLLEPANASAARGEAE